MILYRQKLFNRFEKKVISTIANFNKRGARKFIKGEGYKNLTNRDSVRMKDAIVAISDFIERKRDLSPKQLKSMSTLLKNAGVTNTEEEAAKQLQILQRKYKNKDAIIRFAKKAERKGGGIKRSEEEINKMLAERDKALQENTRLNKNLEERDRRVASMFPHGLSEDIKEDITSNLNKRGILFFNPKHVSEDKNYFTTRYGLGRRDRKVRNVKYVFSNYDVDNETREKLKKSILDNAKNITEYNIAGRNGHVVSTSKSPAIWAHEGGHGLNYTNFSPKENRVLEYRFGNRKNWRGPEEDSRRGLKNIAKGRLKRINRLREELQASSRGYRLLEKVLKTRYPNSAEINKNTLGLAADSLANCYGTYSTGGQYDLMQDALKLTSATIKR